MSEEMDEVCARVFLRDQLKLVPKTVVEDIPEAIEFLEDCGALVFDTRAELVEYMSDEGIDFDEDELEETLEVFVLPDGRYLYVEV